MSMKTISLAAILLAISLMNVNVTVADDKEDVMMTGTIVAIDGDKLRIQTPNVGVQIFKFKDGVQRPANLAVGTKVTMWVDEDDADDNPPGEQVESETYTVHRMMVTPTVTTTEERKAVTTTEERRAAAPPATYDDPATRTREELPQTASPLAAIGLTGLFAIAGGLGLRMKSRRSAK